MRVSNLHLQFSVKICHNIILGYNSIVNMTKEEQEAVPYVILSIQLICVAWFSEREHERELFEINKQMTKWIIDSFYRLRFF